MNSLRIAILSLSALTMMAGGAVAPALGNIAAHFPDASPLLIQLIVSLPSLGIIFTSFFFTRVAAHFTIRTLICLALVFYIISGCGAGLADNIYAVLLCRGLLGVTIGFIMPLSVGLIPYFFNREEQVALLGRSSAMNNLGGIVAMSISGILAAMSWRYSFGIYGFAVIPLILCFLYLPNQECPRKSTTSQKGDAMRPVPLYIAMFTLMVLLIAFVANFSMVCAKDQLLPASVVGIVMATDGLLGFLVGSNFKRIHGLLGRHAIVIAGLLVTLGFVCLSLAYSPAFVILSIVIFGTGRGILIPLLNIKLTFTVDKEYATTAMSRMSAALYAGQFFSPLIIMQVYHMVGSTDIRFPYHFAIVLGLLLTLGLKLFIEKIGKE